MDFHDYVRAVRRSVALIVVATVAGGLIAAAYLVVAPRKWDSTALLLMSANAPSTISEAKTGADYAGSAVNAASILIDSPVVLAGVADDLGGEFTIDQLQATLSVTPEGNSGVLSVQATAGSAETAQKIADAVAQRAGRTIPGVIGGVDSRGNPLMRLDVIQSAAEATSPTSPNRNGVLGIGVLVGLCAGVAFAIVRFTLDTRIRDAEDLRAVGVPLLGAIPRRSRRDAGSLLVRDAPLSPSGEAYRGLRTNVLSMLPDRGATMVIAPVGSPHDIAAIAAGLAWSCAETLRLTVVLDLDIRNPGIERALDLPPAPGAAEVLSDVVDLNQALRTTTNGRLWVLGAGSTSGSPSDLLASSQLGKLLGELRTRFDVVIVRAPALSMYADASIVARSTDAAVLVVRAGRDREAEVQGAVGAIMTVSSSPIGTVMDGVSARRRRRFFGQGPVGTARRLVPANDVMVVEDVVPLALDVENAPPVVRPRVKRTVGGAAPDQTPVDAGVRAAGDDAS